MKKNSYTITLPDDVAEFVETQYLVIRRRFPRAKFTRVMLVELYFKSGVISFTGVISRLDSLTASFGRENEARMLKSFEKIFFTTGMKGLVKDAKSAFDGVAFQINGNAIVPNKPVRAVQPPKGAPKTCINCGGKTTLKNGKPCPSCRPVSAGLKPKPAKLRLVKK